MQKKSKELEPLFSTEKKKTRTIDVTRGEFILVVVHVVTQISLI